MIYTYHSSIHEFHTTKNIGNGISIDCEMLQNVHVELHSQIQSKEDIVHHLFYEVLRVWCKKVIHLLEDKVPHQHLPHLGILQCEKIQMHYAHLFGALSLLDYRQRLCLGGNIGADEKVVLRGESSVVQVQHLPCFF